MAKQVSVEPVCEVRTMATTSDAIQKTSGVCGGAARVGNRRITVWQLVNARKLGVTEASLLDEYPVLTQADLDACWSYYREHPVEIEREIWFNDTSANVPDGSPPPSWVLVAGLLLGLPESEIREAFDPPLTEADLTAAWDAYRANPGLMGREIAQCRLAG
jgi:uncharacterized protein (DUF433 family)